MNGAKTLVLDPTLAGPLGLITEVSLLKVSNTISYMQLVYSPILAPWCGQDVLARARAVVRNLHEYRLSLSATHQVD